MQRTIKKRLFSGTMDSSVQEYEIEHRNLARSVAADGIVLLENKNHVLPLEQGSQVALYGAGASKTIKGGMGSGDVNEREDVTICQGMKNAGFQIANENWLKAYDALYHEKRVGWREKVLENTAKKESEGNRFGLFHAYCEMPFSFPVGQQEKKAECKHAIFILSRIAGEGADRFNEPGDYILTEEEENLLESICKLYPHVIVVINTGGLVDLSFMNKYERIEGLIQLMQPGMEGGNAFADVVSGKVTPSGKVTDSWAYHYEDYPNSVTFSHNNGNVDTENYEEGLYVGYRYFDTFQVPVRYGFGYGLSYTEFELKVLSIDLNVNGKFVEKTAEKMCIPKVRISVSVKNIGKIYQGKEVVQIYASCPNGRLEKEYRRLVGFAKTKALKPGENETLELEIPLTLLTSYDERTPGWILENGFYGIWIGNSLETSELSVMLQLDEDVLVTKTEHICPQQQELRELSQNDTVREKRYKEWVEQAKKEQKKCLQIGGSTIKTKEIIYATIHDKIVGEAEALVEQLTIEQLIQLVTGNPEKGTGSTLGAAGISIPGSAGETSSCAESLGIASIVLADGPAGLRLNQTYHVDNGKIIKDPFEVSLEGGFFCKEKLNQPGDCYYQYCTAIPVGTLLAQTWNTKLIEEVGAMIGREMQNFHITLWLAPGMNIHRNPLCGRNFEYYSEDPFLSGIMAAAMTNGVQSERGCGTTIKHLACNNQEDNRKHSDSVLSERTLREIYLKGFEIAVKESQPMSIMTSYNLINGVHAANSYDLCTKLTRAEWGFEGCIMTDWTTTEQGTDCTAAGCVWAGNDLIMPGVQCDQENLKKELESGELSFHDLKRCVINIVNVILKSNQYEID